MAITSSAIQNLINVKKRIIELRERETLGNRYNWDEIARANQRAPEGSWLVWLLLAGRGFGKTRSGVEWVRELVENAKEPLRIAFLGSTPADVRDVLIEGKSGILAISPPWCRPHYEPSKRRLTWPNGCVATTYSYENPDQLRGPEHHYALCDELVTADKEEVWDNLMFGLRLGASPRVMVTTTPKPKPLIKRIYGASDTIVTTGSTYDNKENLPVTFIKVLEEKYAGTRLGRQEIYAEILDDIVGALWNYANIEQNRIKSINKDELTLIVVAVDPAASSGVNSDETGIIICGVDQGGHGYILEDATLRGTPNQRAHQIKRMYNKWEANYVVAEKNNGGDMVSYMIKSVPDGHKMKVKLVHASRGKFTRAEPIAALYEQNKVSHVGGNLSLVEEQRSNLSILEDELCSWTPQSKDSPNRLDALVWGLTEIMLEARKSAPSLRSL